MTALSAYPGNATKSQGITPHALAHEPRHEPHKNFMRLSPAQYQRNGCSSDGRGDCRGRVPGGAQDQELHVQLLLATHAPQELVSKVLGPLHHADKTPGRTVLSTATLHYCTM